MYAVVGCMYMEWLGACMRLLGAKYAETVGCMFAVVGCKVCGNAWVQSMRLLDASLTTAINLSDSR